MTNSAPNIVVKNETGRDANHRKIYDSGTTLTADLLKELVTVTDAEDSATLDENKPFGAGNVKIISQNPAANGTGITPAGLYEVTLAAVDSQGKEGTQVKVYVAVKEEKPSAPTVGQWQNGNVKVTPNSTNSGDKITIPLKSGSVVVTKDAQNGWQVTGQPNGVSVHNGSIEIPRDLVNATVTATASKGEGDVKVVSNEGTHTLTPHEVTKVDIVKKPTDKLNGTDLYSATGITGVVENGVTKTYQNAGIQSVTSVGTLPTLRPDSETEVPVLITYNDGSQEKTNVKLKVAPSAPNVIVQPQDKTTGDVTLTIKHSDDTNYPDDSVVTVPGIDGTFKVKDGTITIKNNQLKEQVQTSKVIVKEGTKLAAETSDNKTIPAKLVDSKNPTIEKVSQDPETGAVTYKVKDPDNGNYPEGATVTINGNNYPVTGGTVTVPNDKLPEAKKTETPKVQESGKLPKTANEVEVPAKLASAKGEPAREFEVTIPLPIVVPDPEHLTPKEIEKLVDKVKESNPNTIVTADDKGNVTVTDKTTGESVLIPVKDLTVKDFEPVKPTEKVPVKDKSHLTPEEKKQVADKVKDKNPGKEVTVGDDGTATVTDPTTGISHTIPGTDLVNQDFDPVKPTEKVPVKDKSHLTPEEKKQVADKVKDKNPGKEVTVGDDGTATVTDPTTGISHTIPGTDLVTQDFEPVKPTEKVPVKDKSHLTPEEKKQVADKVKAKSPGKEVTVGDDGTATVTDPTTGISHTIPGTDLVTQDFEPVKPTEKVPVKDKSHLTPEEKKQVADKVKAKNPGKEVTVGDDGTATVTDPTTGISHTIPATDLVIEFAKGDSTRLEVPGLIITKWTDEQGNELKPADAKAPNVLGEANEAFEHGEIEGYVFVRTETKGDVVTHIFRKVSPARPTGDDDQEPATPSADTNPRLNNATPAEASATQPQAVLPNTGTKTDRATGALGVLSLLGTVGLLFAKKKKDDEEEA